MFSGFIASVLVLVLLGFAEPGASQPAGSGLTAAQKQQLHALGFAVAPSSLPPGFHVEKVTVNASARRYTIVYLRGSDGATMTFAGVAAGSDAAPKKKHGFFQGLGSSISQIGHKESTTSVALRSDSAEHVTPEQEQEMSAVSSDSALTGPIHFAPSGRCLKGKPESSKALITNAHFAISACKLKYPDPLIRAYKNLTRL
jgi:hypothetical protein